MDTSKVTRVEVIDSSNEDGHRVYTAWSIDSYNEDGHRVYTAWSMEIKVEVFLQDDGRTLKVFISKK